MMLYPSVRPSDAYSAMAPHRCDVGGMGAHGDVMGRISLVYPFLGGSGVEELEKFGFYEI